MELASGEKLALPSTSEQTQVHWSGFPAVFMFPCCLTSKVLWSFSGRQSDMESFPVPVHKGIGCFQGYAALLEVTQALNFRAWPVQV